MRRLLAATALLLTWNCAQALTVTSFTDRASWEAAVGSFTLETFDTAPLAFGGSEACGPDVLPMNNSTVDVGDFSVTVDRQHSSCVGFYRNSYGVYFSGDLHSYSFPTAQFESMTFDRLINAFAVDGGFSDMCGQIWCNGGALASIGGVFNVTIPFGSSFFGVIADYGFTEVRFTKPCCERAYHSLDNVSYRFVPEPSSLTLIGIALALFSLRRARSR